MAAIVVALVSGCSVGAPDDDTDAATDSTDVESEHAGDLATAALERFDCAPGDDGLWVARGRVRNDDDEPLSYQVTVVVSEGTSADGITTRLENVQPDGSAPFELPGLPPAGENPVCQVRVIVI